VRSFLIIHGWQGSGPEHWQSWLADRLRHAGEHVSYPVLPDPDEPVLEAWRTSLAAELGALPGERTVLCHSLGCLLWLHHVATTGKTTVAGRVLLAAPPSDGPGSGAAVPELAPFFPVPLDARAVAGAARETRVAFARDDPYCPAGAAALYATPLGLPADEVPAGGHLNTDAGYGPWPAMEQWCLGRRPTLGP